MKRILILPLFLSLLAVMSCKKKETNPDTEKISYTDGAWIVNEGAFQFGNGSVGFIKRDGSHFDNVFKKVNNRPLGDVFQSMSSYENFYYMVINNSQRIEIADQDMKSIGSIEGFNSPRYFTALSNNKAYVSDFAAEGIWVVNPAEKKIIKKIAYNPSNSGYSPSWTEQMYLNGNTLFVCGVYNGEILVINTTNDEITDTIKVGTQPQWITKDNSGKLWVLCNGSLEKKESALYRINPADKKVEKVIPFTSADANPSRLQINGSGSKLYFLNKGVYEMSINDENLPTMPILKETDFNFYGLGIDPSNSDIYVTDVKDFSRQGVVYKYDATGNLKTSFEAGVVPSAFLFKN